MITCGKRPQLHTDAPEWRQRARAWIAATGAQGALETWLVKQAAIASVRVDCCVRNQSTLQAARLRRAMAAWRSRQARWRDECIADFEREPSTVVTRLKKFSAGCDWLIRQWRSLRRQLRVGGFWTTAERDRALRLLGCIPAQLSANEPVAIALLANHLAASAGAGRLSQQRVRTHAAFRSARHTGLPSARVARARLRALADRQADRLRVLRERTRRENDEPRMRAIVDRLSLDDSPATARLRSLESDYHRQVDSYLRALGEVRARTTSLAAHVQSPQAVAQPGSPPTTVSGCPIPTLRNEPIVAAGTDPTPCQPVPYVPIRREKLCQPEARHGPAPAELDFWEPSHEGRGIDEAWDAALRLAKW